MYLSRKIDDFLKAWKNREHLPLLVKGARQVGKTSSILRFGKEYYQSLVYVNFFESPKYKSIIASGYDVNDIIREMSIANPDFRFIPGKTLIVFDGIQEFPDIVTSLKFFKIDGRFDVIVSGSLLGVHYRKIMSFSIGYQEDYEMRSMDFGEFLLARGRSPDLPEQMLARMYDAKPFSEAEFTAYSALFREYCILGGMPDVVSSFVNTGNFSRSRELQRMIREYYRADARKYCEGLDAAKIVSVYDSVVTQLGKENKKFTYSDIRKGTKARDWSGCVEWLSDAGMVMKAENLDFPELPLAAHASGSAFKLYCPDTGLLLSSLDEETALDFSLNRNLNTYKGGIMENIVAEALAKAGKKLYYYSRQNSTLEIDFILRNANRLVPVEVKAANNKAKSMNILVAGEKYADVEYGVKLANANTGFSSNVYTFPHFCAFLLPQFLSRISMTDE